MSVDIMFIHALYHHRKVKKYIKSDLISKNMLAVQISFEFNKECRVDHKCTSIYSVVELSMSGFICGFM